MYVAHVLGFFAGYASSASTSPTRLGSVNNTYKGPYIGSE